MAAPKTCESCSGRIWVPMAAKVKTRFTPRRSAWPMSCEQNAPPLVGGCASPMKTMRSCRFCGSCHRKSRLRGRRPVLIRPSFTSTRSRSKNSRAGKLGQQMHAELGHQIVAGADRHRAHSGPCGDQPGIIEMLFLFHTPAFTRSVTDPMTPYLRLGVQFPLRKRFSSSGRGMLVRSPGTVSARHFRAAAGSALIRLGSTSAGRRDATPDCLPR